MGSEPSPASELAAAAGYVYPHKIVHCKKKKRSKKRKGSNSSLYYNINTIQI
jgi:hypothetical protein